MEIFLYIYNTTITNWGNALLAQNFIYHLIAAIIFCMITLMIEISGGAHTKKVVAPSLHDIILDRLPVIDLNFLFVETMGTLIIVFFIFHLAHPQTLPFVLASLCLFTLIRRAFLIMTPLGPPKKMLATFGFKPHRTFSRKVFQGDGDYFFSGHTGMPFLFFLLTPWPPLAFVFLMGSIIMGIAVLCMHIHYSIDVFAAPFIVYGIFILSRTIFT